MKTTFIYALCEPGTRTVRYIGKANDPKRRFRAHLQRSIKVSNHLGAWLRSLLSLGEKPNLVVLREVPVEQWQIAEERYIRLARGCGMKLVNGTDGGDGMHNPSAETRAKMSAGQRERMAVPGVRENIAAKLRGNIPSPETCAKISAAAIGRIKSPETREKMSASKLGPKNPNFGGLPAATLAAAIAANTGAKRSPDACRNISNSLKGKSKSASHIANMSGEKSPWFGKTGEANPNFGSKRSEETKAKMRKPKSELAKANMRAAWVVRKENYPS